MLSYCWNLREIPQGIGEIPTLELIEVDSSFESLGESAKQIAEDQQSYGNIMIFMFVSKNMLFSRLELYLAFLFFHNQ